MQCIVKKMLPGENIQGVSVQGTVYSIVYKMLPEKNIQGVSVQDTV